MVYLDSISAQQTLFIPKCREARGAMMLSVRNTISHSVLVHTDVTDMGASDIYYRFSIALPADITGGEYEYSLMDEDGVISTGLLIIGKLSGSIEYNKGMTYEQYKK